MQLEWKGRGELSVGTTLSMKVCAYSGNTHSPPPKFGSISIDKIARIRIDRQPTHPILNNFSMGLSPTDLSSAH